MRRRRLHRHQHIFIFNIISPPEIHLQRLPDVMTLPAFAPAGTAFRLPTAGDI